MKGKQEHSTNLLFDYTVNMLFEARTLGILKWEIIGICSKSKMQSLDKWQG